MEKNQKPIIKKENVRPLFDSKFIKVFDLQYEEDKHYFDATRRTMDRLAATKSDGEFRAMLPDAVTCVVILSIPDQEPMLLLSKEYRYPAGQFLLSPPAGLLDPEDELAKSPILSAAIREIREETGISLKEDALSIINPLLFSSPGMTDESNALVCAVANLSDLSSLSQKGAVGSERFDGFELLTPKAAREILLAGKDKDGIFYSVYTWAALMYFVSGLWR
ncbi:MAG: NUDIX hydrolase [Lachnospiraceae bacterium]|nr:NUDIX hydrolase [Lachnospiraceae bacterium]